MLEYLIFHLFQNDFYLILSFINPLNHRFHLTQSKKLVVSFLKLFLNKKNLIYNLFFNSNVNLNKNELYLKLSNLF